MTGSSSGRGMTICQIGAFHEGTGRTPTNADALKGRLPEMGIDSICASYRLGGLRRAWDMALTLVTSRARYSTVLVHVFSGRAYLWALMATRISKLMGKRVILWLHGGNLPTYSISHPRLVRAAFGYADRIIAPSGYLQSAFSDRFEVGILPYDLPVADYRFHERKAPQPRLLWLRAFNSAYNPQMAVRVVHRLAESYPTVHLTMCGPDNGDGSFQATQRIARELGVAQRIEMPGKVSKERIRELGQECDIFINTTNYDNTPVSVIEAMAMGMCVVSTNVGGVPYLVSDEHDGLLVPADDHEKMAAACASVLSDEGLAADLSVNARQTALGFDWRSLAPLWNELLRENSDVN